MPRAVPLLVALGTLAALTGSASRASACSGGCPDWLAAVPDGSTLPGQLGGPTVFGATALFTLAGPGGDVSFTAVPRGGGFALVPKSPVAEGTTLTLTRAPDCAQGAWTQSFVVGAATGAPPALGVLSASATPEPAEVWTTDGACTKQVPAKVVHLHVAEPADAAAYAAFGRREVLMDGKVLATQRGPVWGFPDLLPTVDALDFCHPTAPAPGKHVVRVRVDGLPAELATNELTIDVDCTVGPQAWGEPVPGAGGAGGASTGGTGGVAGAAGGVAGAAGVGTPAGRGGGGQATATGGVAAPTEDEGCGCRVAAGGTHASWAACFGLVFAAAGLRRARRRR